MKKSLAMSREFVDEVLRLAHHAEMAAPHLDALGESFTADGLRSCATRVKLALVATPAGSGEE
jgi:hypothetical protein